MPDTSLCYARRAMDLPTPVPRDAVRVALAEAAAATNKAMEAADHADRALALVESARAAVASYADLDAVVAAFHAGSPTQCADGPGHLAADPIEAKVAQAAAETALVNAQAAHALLAAVATEAEGEAKRAEARKAAAIADVMRATAVGMLPQLRDAEALAGRLRASIAGYLNYWMFNTQKGFEPLPVEVSLLIKEPQAAPLMALAALSWQQAAMRWQEYCAELATDPDAKPPAALG